MDRQTAVSFIVYIGVVLTFKMIKVPTGSVPLAEPGKTYDPHLLGLDPGLPRHSGAVLQCCKLCGPKVDGDEVGEYRDRLMALQVNFQQHHDVYNI